MNSKLARDSVYSLQVDVNVEGAALHPMKNEVEPIEKHSRQESLWRVGAHYTSFPELVFITSRYDLRLSSHCSNPLSMQIC